MPECKTVGVMGDARTYEMTCALRAVGFVGVYGFVGDGRSVVF